MMRTNTQHTLFLLVCDAGAVVGRAIFQGVIFGLGERRNGTVHRVLVVLRN